MPKDPPDPFPARSILPLNLYYPIPLYYTILPLYSKPTYLSYPAYLIPLRLASLPCIAPAKRPTYGWLGLRQVRRSKNCR